MWASPEGGHVGGIFAAASAVPVAWAVGSAGLVDQAELAGAGDGFGAVGGAEFVQEVADVNRPGMSGDFIRWKDEGSWHVPRCIRVSCVSALCAWWWSPRASIRASSRRSARLRRGLGIGSSETLRKWVRRAEIDGGIRPGKTSGEIAEIRELKKENAELRRANEILKSASAFFAAELDRPHRY